MNGGGYLERPRQHRTVSIGSLSLPERSGELGVDLPSMENLSEKPRPDGDGSLADWLPTDAHMFFFVNVWFPETGEKTADEEFTALRQAVKGDAVRINHRQEIGEVSDSDAASRAKSSGQMLYDYANGPLLNNY